jgi:hypothetical protein
MEVQWFLFGQFIDFLILVGLAFAFLAFEAAGFFSFFLGGCQYE